MAERNLHEKLMALGYNPEQGMAVRKMVSVSEKGKAYKLQVNGSRESVIYQVDGNIITDGNKCDKMILVEHTADDWTQILVELKGADVGHVILQLESTLKYPKLRHVSNKVKMARIVATSFPSSRGNPILEKAKIRFLRNYNCDLRGMKSNQPDKI